MLKKGYWIGKHRSEETKKKISESLKGKSSWNKGKKLSKEHKKKLSESHRGRRIGFALNPVFTKEHREKLSRSHKGQISWSRGQKLSKERCEECSNIMKRLWQDSEFVRKQIISRGVVPNKTEMVLDKIIQRLLPNQYKFVGDGEFILGGKCPDFVNINGQKKIIELFGDYWHDSKIQGVSKEQHVQERKDVFAKYGYGTLIIWECELKDLEKVEEKIISFN